MPTQASRERFVVGSLGRYECATVAATDHHLGRVARRRLIAPAEATKAWRDINLLLEKRHSWPCSLCTGTKAKA